MEEFAGEFRKRFDSASPHGSRKKVAAAARVSVGEVSRWGKQIGGKWQIPTIFEIFEAARVLGVSPCWLAFDRGAVAAPTPAEIEVVEAFKDLDAEAREHLLGLARGWPRQAQTSAPHKPEALPLGTVIRVPEKGVKTYEPPEPDETSSEEPVASKAQEDKPAYSDEDAAAWVRGLSVKHGKRSNVDLRQAQEAQPVQLPRFDERAAADGTHGSTVRHIPGVPIVHETVASHLKFDRQNHYMLDVSGNSMEPEIREGDTIVVKRMNLYMPAYDDQAAPADPAAWKALDNKVVVAVLDEGLDAVVKRLSVIKRKDTGFKVLLLSDNRRVKPIEIDKTNSIRVIGHVVGSFHAL